VSHLIALPYRYFALRGTGDLDAAVSQFRAAIQSVPHYAPAHFELAIALRQMGKQEEAAEEFQRAAELDPKLVAPLAPP